MSGTIEQLNTQAVTCDLLNRNFIGQLVGTTCSAWHMHQVSYLVPPAHVSPIPWEFTMLRWAIAFLVIALVAAILGFTSLEGTAMWAAKITFVVFVILFVVSLVFNGRTPKALT